MSFKRTPTAAEIVLLTAAFAQGGHGPKRMPGGLPGAGRLMPVRRLP